MRARVCGNTFWKSARGVFPWKGADGLIWFRFRHSCSLSGIGMKVTQKLGTSKPGSECFGAGCYTGNYCKRRAKDALHERRFQLAGLVLCLQWDTRDTPPRVSTRASRLLVVGIRSDTR